MNEILPSVLAQRSVEVAQARFALRVTAALSDHQSLATHADIDARLRFAREQALARTHQASAGQAAAASVVGLAGGAALLGGGSGGMTTWWLRLGSALPLAVLLGGLALIDSQYSRSKIEAMVEVDVAILADTLPPEAYRDQGFVEFLKTARP